MKNKYLIHCETNWCGESIYYAAIAESLEELDDVVQQAAYENFDSYNGFMEMMEGEFGPEEEQEDGCYDDDQLEWGYQNESFYYSGIAQLCETEDDFETFNDSELIYGEIEEEGTK